MHSNLVAKLAANKWIITSRWYYLIVVGLLALAVQSGWLVRREVFNTGLFSSDLFLIFIGVWLLNFVLFLLANHIEQLKSYDWVGRLSAFQVTTEALLILILLYAWPDLRLVLPILGLVTVIEAIILFEDNTPVYLAVFFTFILNLVYLAEHSNWLELLRGRASGWEFGAMPFTDYLLEVLFFSVVYLGIGFVATFISHYIRQRERLFEEEVEEDAYNIARLKHYNQEVAKSTRELKAKDLELTMANKRLESLEEAKSKFIAVTTHQLRTPLSGIRWTFDLLLSGRLGKVDDEQKEFLERGLAGSERMIHIVNDLLNADKIETKADKMEVAPLQPGLFLEGIIKMFQAPAASKNISLRLEKPERPLPALSAAEGELSVVFENLIDNAIKYTPVGGEVTVTISDENLNSSTPTIVISVRDTGEGIPKTEQGKIFQKFFRASNAVRMEPDGSGLGLFIAREIVERHQGTLWYDSVVGEGTVFHVSLPLRQKGL